MDESQEGSPRAASKHFSAAVIKDFLKASEIQQQP